MAVFRATVRARKSEMAEVLPSGGRGHRDSVNGGSKLQLLDVVYQQRLKGVLVRCDVVDPDPALPFLFGLQDLEEGILDLNTKIQL